MNVEEYAQMYRLESSHWYFVGKARLIRRMLACFAPPQARLLDVGCGTGNILDVLKQFGEAVGIDASPVALEFCRRRGLQHLHLGDVSARLPAPDESYDIVCAFDVLEHLEDDMKALAELQRVCQPGGHILLTVPALPILWSAHDEALAHKRRYTKQKLSRLLRQAGLRLRKVSYTNALLFPLALAYRLTGRMSQVRQSRQQSDFFVELPRWMNTAFLGVFTLEGILLTRMNFPLGVSLLCVCEKGPTES
jgi:ubiquinone/menaquinone biosynthesis C-methylase UbiE